MDVFTAPLATGDPRIVDARGVSKFFGDRQILHDVDLEVMRGEVVTLVGPSGAGKTTMLRTLNRLEEIDGGEIRINGELLGQREDARGTRKQLGARDLARQRANIGFVFQHFNLFPHMTVLENIAYSPVEVKREEEGCRRLRPRAARSRGSGRQGRRPHAVALGRSAAARGHRAGARHASRTDAVR